jgi:L-aminopeptidase/D-esterase-like protein
VVLGPFRGAAEVAGVASGTRDLQVLTPDHPIGQVDALVLSGGSSFGLSAVDGVVSWLEERAPDRQGIRPRVPLVPAATIYDLADGVGRPDAQMGREACRNASDRSALTGVVGVGAGARVGAVNGPTTAMAGGLGTWSVTVGDHTVGALTVVNAFGDVLDAWGGIVAGARGPDGVFINTSRHLRDLLSREGGGAMLAAAAAQSTTLSVVATDAPLSRIALLHVARLAATALPRRISPVNTPFDGDVTFAVSTAPTPQGLPLGDVLAIGTLARDCLESAIESAVTTQP